MPVDELGKPYNVRVIRAAKPVCQRMTERCKVLNPEYSIFRDQPIPGASPLRINTLLSGRIHNWSTPVSGQRNLKRYCSDLAVIVSREGFADTALNTRARVSKDGRFAEGISVKQFCPASVRMRILGSLKNAQVEKSVTMKLIRQNKEMLVCHQNVARIR